MLNINSITNVADLIEKGIIESHGINTENLSDLTKLKIYRRLNQMLKLCIFFELYRQKNATHFEPLLERKAMYHAMYSLFSINPLKARQFQLSDIIILFHSEITNLQLSGSTNDFIKEQDERVELFTLITRNSWRVVSPENRYMHEYFWNEFPIEEAHRILGELI